MKQTGKSQKVSESTAPEALDDYNSSFNIDNLEQCFLEDIFGSLQYDDQEKSFGNFERLETFSLDPKVALQPFACDDPAGEKKVIREKCMHSLQLMRLYRI